MARRQSILLFGEGKTEAVFLSHLRALYAPEIRARVLVDAGQGGSPRQLAERMIRKHLDLGSYDSSLLLLDADVPAHDIPATWLSKHGIRVVSSAPLCLEGMFLSLLDDPPPAKERHLSRNWKQRFGARWMPRPPTTPAWRGCVSRRKRGCSKPFPIPFPMASLSS